MDLGSCCFQDILKESNLKYIQEMPILKKLQTESSQCLTSA